MEKYMSYIIIAAMVLFVMLIMYIGERNRKKELIEKVLASYGKPNKKKYEYDQFSCIPHYYKQHKDDRFTIDDITWNDLELDNVFMALDNTQSSAGQEYLYSVLRTPLMDRAELDERERIISFLDANDKQRSDIQTLCHELGFTRRITIFDYLKGFLGLDVKLGIIRYLPTILFFAAIGLTIYHVSLGILGFIVVLIVNVLLYFREKASIDSYFVCVAYISRLIKCAKKLSAYEIPELKEYLDTLKQSVEPLSVITKKAAFVNDPRAISGSLFDTVMEYFNMIFHIDLFMFYSSLNQVKKNIEEIEKIIEVIGKLETSIAIGSYRRTIPFYCIPEFTEDNIKAIKAEDMYHPGILEPVANSIDEKKSVLLTGSNASGKSTFLKTVAINAILAQTIHTCTAKAILLPITRVMSSMSLRDDLSGGDSYYMVEIKALKRIMDQANNANSIPVMCFVDEVLRGTNTVERIAASSEILLQLDKNNSFVFAATHDIELTYILEKEYSNYHFNEEVKNDDVYFSYILHKGRATTRNAIRLLGIMGYDKEVIEEAEKRAKLFTETGEWA